MPKISGLHYVCKMTIWPIILMIAGCLLLAGDSTAQARPDRPEYSQVTLQVLSDTWIAEGYPGSNCGNQAYLAAGYDWTNPVRGRVRSLIKFDLSSLPEGALIDDATLGLYYVDSNGPGTGEYTTSVARVTGPWAEDSVEWSHAPPFTVDAPITTTIVHGDSQWVWLDVTSLVQDWTEGQNPNYGIVLLGPEEISEAATTEFFESGDNIEPIVPGDGLHPPRLEVTYHVPGASPSFDTPPIPLIPVFLPLLLKDFPPTLDLHPIDNDGGEGTYTISWTPHPKGAQYYELFEWAGSGWHLVFTASAGETSYKVSNKPLGVYSYYLKAIAIWGEEMSLVRSVTVSDRPEQFAYLAIGIGDYLNMPPNNTQIPQFGLDLVYPVFDATDIQDMLQVHGAVEYPADQALAITGRRATKSGIQEAITGWLDAHEAVNTTVFIYFAGHTLMNNGKPYLAPYDLGCAPCAIPPASSTWLASTAIFAEELFTWLQDLATNRFIFVIDSPGSEQWIAQLQGEGRTILAGSWANENRWEFQDIQNGAFTYYLSQAHLNNADGSLDGKISIDEVLNYTYQSPKLNIFVYQHTLDIKDGPFQQHAVSFPGAFDQDGFIKTASVQACQPLP